MVTNKLAKKKQKLHVICISYVYKCTWVQTQRSALLGKCLKTRSSGQPMPCEGNWEVS